MPSFERTRSAGYMTNWAARLFAKVIYGHLKPLGVTPGQLPVFFALGDGAELSQKALTQIAAIEQPTMAETLSRMERDGLVRRRPDPNDKRSMLISLTPAALEKAQAVREAIQAVNNAALADLPDTERESYLAMLRTIVASLEGLSSGN